MSNTTDQSFGIKIFVKIKVKRGVGKKFEYLNWLKIDVQQK